MTFSLDPEVGAVLAAVFESNGPPPTPPVGDIDGRRAALDPMLDYWAQADRERILRTL